LYPGGLGEEIANYHIIDRLKSVVFVSNKGMTYEFGKLKEVRVQSSALNS